MAWVRVSLGERSYPILIGEGLLARTGSLLKKMGLDGRNLVIVSQKNLVDSYGQTLSQSLSRENIEHQFFTVPEGKSSEAAKSQTVFLKLVRHLARADGRHRALGLVALGGGVVGDLSGFAAAVYRRGIPYIQIPTTLTAQVDSAIGGKTALDLPEGKNLLGAVYQPAFVLADTAVLKSLPDRHWSDGFAEVIKYGIMGDPALFRLLEENGLSLAEKPKLLENVIERCAKMKARVVEKDELDKKGVRIVLNFGHTVGHAIEAASKYSFRYTHGEAVGIGMLAACGIAEAMKCLKESDLPRRLAAVLMKFHLPLYFKGLSVDAILEAASYDKKSQKGKNRFVLPVRLGKVVVVKDVPAAAIREALIKRKA